MPADCFLTRLEKVRPTGKDRWQACCPAHEDRSPSLSVKIGDDGRLLVHCFAGCTAQEIVESVGMQLSDLFPENGFDRGAYALHKRVQARVERAELDTLIVKIAKGDIASGKTLTPNQQKEVQAAVARLQGVLQ